MTPHLFLRILPRTLIAAVVLFSLAAPASAKLVYRWKTDDGVHAFTDNPKQIPAKYRSQAKATQMRSLRGYRNYTPAQTSGTKAHVKRNLETARELQKLNARIYGEDAGAPMVFMAPSGEQTVYRVGSDGYSNLEVQTSLGGAEPVVSEQRRYYVPGTNATRTDTVVRQGDRIIAITKPVRNQINISDIPSESTID